MKRLLCALRGHDFTSWTPMLTRIERFCRRCHRYQDKPYA